MRVLFFTGLFFLSILGKAQHYNFSAGVKLDDSFIALTAQKRVAKQTTLEAMLPLSNNDISLVLLGKQHYRVIGNRMNIYTVGAATQGLSNYLKKEFSNLPEIKVAIA